jgi:hypothetical protein
MENRGCFKFAFGKTAVGYPEERFKTAVGKGLPCVKSKELVSADALRNASKQPFYPCRSTANLGKRGLRLFTCRVKYYV